MGREDGSIVDVQQVSRAGHHDKLSIPDAGLNHLCMLDRGARILFAGDDQDWGIDFLQAMPDVEPYDGKATADVSFTWRAQHHALDLLIALHVLAPELHRQPALHHRVEHGVERFAGPKAGHTL